MSNLALVYYVDAGDHEPADAEDISGAIEFLDPRSRVQMFTSPGSDARDTLLSRPQSGVLLVFPSWCLHARGPAESASSRQENARPPQHERGAHQRGDVIQRFDSALRMNVHFHSLFLAGAFVRGEDGELEFHELDEPSPEQAAEVAERTAKRVAKLLEKEGRSLDSALQDDEEEDFAHRQPALASLYAAAARGVDLSGDRAGQPTMRLIEQDSAEKKEPHAVVGGINLHAAVAFDARDKPRMERMCRYLARPPIAQQRLTQRSEAEPHLHLCLALPPEDSIPEAVDDRG